MCLFDHFLHDFLTGIVVARIRTTKLDSSAYKDMFQALFSKVKEYHPKFEVGKTLNGIICDWSDTQLRGLEEAVGVNVSKQVVKGCQVRMKSYHYIQYISVFSSKVHYQCSVKRVGERTNKVGSLGYKAFVYIGYEIPRAKTKENIMDLFAVLSGEKSLSIASSILHSPKILGDYAKEHDASRWSASSHWCKWWMRDKHLSKQWMLLLIIFFNIIVS